MQQDIIQQFLEQMLDEAGLGQMPESFKKNYLVKLKQELNQRIGRDAVALLSKEDLEAFNELVEDPKLVPEQVLEFFNSHLENFPEFMQEVLADFKKEFVEQAAALEKIQKQKQ